MAALTCDMVGAGGDRLSSSFSCSRSRRTAEETEAGEAEGNERRGEDACEKARGRKGRRGKM